MSKKNYRKLIVSDVVFCVIHAFNILMIGDSQELSLIPLVLWDLLLCLMYLMIHGIATYSAYRRIFYPHFITGIIILIATAFLFLCSYGDKRWVLGSSIFLCAFFVLSLISSLITKLIYTLHARKQSNTEKPHKAD